MLLDYQKSNDKYTKLLREISLNQGVITEEQSKLKYRSNIPKDYIQSRGEILVQTILIKKSKYFLKEVEFQGCTNPKTKRKLRFDFYLPKDNIIIEYDGIQHYESVEDFDDNDKGKALKNRQILDTIKTNFCKKNNIKLLRIKYNDIDKYKLISNFIN